MPLLLCPPQRSRPHWMQQPKTKVGLEGVPLVALQVQSVPSLVLQVQAVGESFGWKLMILHHQLLQVIECDAALALQ